MISIFSCTYHPYIFFGKMSVQISYQFLTVFLLLSCENSLYILNSNLLSVIFSKDGKFFKSLFFSHLPVVFLNRKGDVRLVLKAEGCVTACAHQWLDKVFSACWGLSSLE